MNESSAIALMSETMGVGVRQRLSFINKRASFFINKRKSAGGADHGDGDKGGSGGDNDDITIWDITIWDTGSDSAGRA